MCITTSEAAPADFHNCKLPLFIMKLIYRHSYSNSLTHSLTSKKVYSSEGSTLINASVCVPLVQLESPLVVVSSSSSPGEKEEKSSLDGSFAVFCAGVTDDRSHPLSS